MIADVAADGLTVELARRESYNRRGRTQTTGEHIARPSSRLRNCCRAKACLHIVFTPPFTAYMTRTVGVIIATMIVGLGMNEYKYNGSFSSGLDYNEICGVLAIPAAIMVPVT